MSYDRTNKQTERQAEITTLFIKMILLKSLMQVPEHDKPSSPFKRSLSRSYSEDTLLFSASSERRKSISQDPPRKAHKPSTR